MRCTSTSASPGSRCAATWNTKSGLISRISSSMAVRSLTSARRYWAPSCLDQPRVTPRLTLTRRPGRRAASRVISVEPIQPVPPVTSTVASRNRSASSASGKHSPRSAIARKRACSSAAPVLAAMSDWVSSRNCAGTLSPRRRRPDGATARMGLMISETVSTPDLRRNCRCPS